MADRPGALGGRRVPRRRTGCSRRVGRGARAGRRSVAETQVRPPFRRPLVLRRDHRNRHDVARTTPAPVVLTCLALTWLNPHVYLDTVFLLGTVANTHGQDRWLFAAGAMIASVAWFFGLAFGARFLSRWLSTSRAWRILDGIIAVVMVALGASLVLTG